MIRHINKQTKNISLDINFKKNDQKVLGQLSKINKELKSFVYISILEIAVHF